MQKVMKTKKVMHLILLVIFLLRGKVFCYRKAVEGYIVGGAFTSINKYPHAVYLDIECNGYWLCGAAILNQNLLLTAAHCVIDCNFNLNDAVYAIAGHEHLYLAPIKRKVKKLVIHENYDPENMIHDICLASLVEPLPLTKTTQRTIIPKVFPKVKYCSVAGWGTVHEKKGITSLQLKYVKQMIKPSDICTVSGDSHPGIFCGISISNAGTEEHPSTGDSGGALVTSTGQEIGIVSYRLIEVPILAYTNTTYYYSWIESNAELLLCN